MIKKKNKKESSSFGDENYAMKERYTTSDLFIAKLQRISSDMTDFCPIVETTEHKYIFEKIVSENKVKYREVFTGFLTEDERDTIVNGCNYKYFDLPYVHEPERFTDYFPETLGIEIPKLSLIWAVNDINYSRNNTNQQQLKKNKK